MSILTCVVQLLFVVTAIERSASQDCVPPSTTDLEIVLGLIIGGVDSAVTPNITLSDFKIVCRVHGEQRDLLRAVSVVVEYTCSSHANCPAATALEQIESECINGQWSSNELGSPANIRSTNPEANLATVTKGDCSHCISPQLASKFSLTTDNITHCRGESCMQRLTTKTKVGTLLLLVKFNILCNDQTVILQEGFGDSVNFQ